MIDLMNVPARADLLVRLCAGPLRLASAGCGDAADRPSSRHGGVGRTCRVPAASDKLPLTHDRRLLPDRLHFEFAPDHAASEVGLHWMSRQSGSFTAVSTASTILPRSTDPAVSRARTFLVFAAIMVVFPALILLVCVHRGGW
jgi:hypothetical protein